MRCEVPLQTVRRSMKEDHEVQMKGALNPHEPIRRRPPSLRSAAARNRYCAAYIRVALTAIADPPPRLTGSAAATMPPWGRNSMAVAAPISAAEVNASPDGVN